MQALVPVTKFVLDCCECICFLAAFHNAVVTVRSHKILPMKENDRSIFVSKMVSS